MEGLSTHLYKGLKKYWKTRGYVRLNNKNDRKTRTQPDPTQVQRKRRRFWRVKISPRVRVWIRVGSPKRWLTRLRDAYVNMMLRISNTGFSGGMSGFGYGVEYGYGYNKGQVKEYDEKMIVEIYKSLMIAQGQLVSRGAGNININNINYDGGDKISESQNSISVSTR
ncbi:hypothetical protein RND81_05G213200 [Saponaria officinalis]|uniref:Uncharacterized protein n=1 Tax=Saponaria officinalis TaxID=3572 RepID=A0AAW1L2V9_SAPOF